MAGLGYGRVADKGFVAFGHDLKEGAWGAVPVTPFTAEDLLPAASLLHAPRLTVFKVRLTWAITALGRAAGQVNVEVLAGKDEVWDSTQRRLNYRLLELQENPAAATKAAAGRVRETLLSGGGSGQTNLGYDQEVDFGRNQGAMARGPDLAADVARLELAPLINEIDSATEDLARALGREPGQARSTPRFQRVRDAVADCVNAFNAVHEELDWMLVHTRPGTEHDQLEALRAPMLGLLARYPTKEGAAKVDPVV